MRTPMHWRTERGGYFQTHPLHAHTEINVSSKLAAIVFYKTSV